MLSLLQTLLTPSDAPMHDCRKSACDTLTEPSFPAPQMPLGAIAKTFWYLSLP